MKKPWRQYRGDGVRLQRGLIVLVLTTSFFGCSKKPQTEIVARVGRDVLTAEMVQQRFPWTYGRDIRKSEMVDYVRRWVDSQLLVQEARRRGLERDPEVRRKMEDTERELLVNALLERELEQSISPSEEEIKSYYEAHRESFARVEDEARALHILVANKDEADAIYRRLLRGEDFATVAKRQSIDMMAQRGGDTGYFTRAGASPEVARAVFSMKKGQISKPIPSSFGYHIVKLLDLQPKATIRKLEEVREEIENRLIEQKKRERFHRLLSQLKNNADVWMDFAPLEKMRSDTSGEVSQSR